MVVTTFPTWHRPYVALYEQLLASKFNDLYKEITDKDRKAAYEALGEKWRLPYWDWGTVDHIPEEWTDENITIQDLCTGNDISVSNPFHHYSFKPTKTVGTKTEPLVEVSFKGYCPFDHWPSTLRQPPTTKIDETSDSSRSNSQLQTEITQIKQQIWDLFPDALPADDPWGQFSNHTWNKINNGTMTSLESIHDHLHDVIGGNGHMGDPAVAGFDPIFFLHHCQVDRLLALWQAVYPSTFVSPGPDLSGISQFLITLMLGTYTHKKDTCQRASDISEKSYLSPFWKTNTQLYTSDDCQDISTLHYTYPEIAAAGGVDVSTKVHESVRKLYDPDYDLTESLSTSKMKTRTKAPTKWIANVQIEKYALGGSGRVTFFLLSKNAKTDIGAIPSDGLKWHESPQYVGSFSIFASNPRTTGCANCKIQDAEGMTIGGTIHLTTAIEKDMGHDPAIGDVVDHLKSRLQWRVSKKNGDEVPVVQVPSLKISIHSRVHGVPTWIHHPDVTHGRLGGLDVAV